MKVELKTILEKVILLLLFGIIYLGIGYLVGIFLSHQFNYKLENVLTYEGVILLIIGILASMKGRPSGINLNGFGQSNANINSYLNNEILRQEREMDPYHKNFHKNNIVKFAFGNLTFIIGGIFILALVIILY
ncbi:MAG: hypothetical protein GX306_04820 [Clostridiales bacterium]|jgi:hypothetical protein|nr:hypothetical protein [Clostridiales bacterium]